jgi:hypothetical protein
MGLGEPCSAVSQAVSRRREHPDEIVDSSIDIFGLWALPRPPKSPLPGAGRDPPGRGGTPPGGGPPPPPPPPLGGPWGGPQRGGKIDLKIGLVPKSYRDFQS